MRIAIPTLNRELGWVALGNKLNLEKLLYRRVLLPLVQIKLPPLLLLEILMTSALRHLARPVTCKMKGILKKKSTLLKKDPPEGKTTAIAAVMRGRPKHSHHR